MKGPRRKLKNVQKEVLSEGLSKYLSESALHGVKYLVDSHIVVKIFWVGIGN